MKRRRRTYAGAAQGAPVAPGTKPPTITAGSGMLAPTVNPGAHGANGLAALSTMAMLTGPTGENLAQLPPERALVFAEALEQLASEYRRLAGTSRGDLALLRQLKPCHDSMDDDAETSGIEPKRPTLNTEEFAWLLGAHPRTVERMRAAGEGPKAIHVRRKVLYRRRDVERYLEGKRS